MIPPQDGQHGVMGTQHGLQRLTDTLEALMQGQAQQQRRDAQMHHHTMELVDHLVALIAGQTRLRHAVLGLSLLTLGLCGVVGWQVTHPPQMLYTRAVGALDSTLVQQWSRMPKSVQEAFSATYSRLGLVP